VLQRLEQREFQQQVLREFRQLGQLRNRLRLLGQQEQSQWWELLVE
jgi:hypothetical protein